MFAYTALCFVMFPVSSQQDASADPAADSSKRQGMQQMMKDDERCVRETREAINANECLKSGTARAHIHLTCVCIQCVVSVFGSFFLATLCNHTKVALSTPFTALTE